MKIYHLFSLLTASSLTVASAFTPQFSAQAGETTFVCGTSDGKPATIAQHPEHGQTPVIYWQSDYFKESGWSPQKRCEKVSGLFQKYHREGLLNYLTTGYENGQPVICVAESQNSGCVGTLFTLKPNDDPKKVVQQLMDFRSMAGGSLYVTGERPYWDFAENLERKRKTSDSEAWW